MKLVPQPLTAAAFTPFGDVIELREDPTKLINAGLCARHDDLARFDVEGDAAISLFDAEPRSLPYEMDLMERHPLGSQAFLPMHEHPFLVTVAPDEGGRPGPPLAFVSDGRQGVNIARNTWHGVLTPLGEGRLFAVVDRVGEGNLEEFPLEDTLTVVHPRPEGERDSKT